MAILHLVRCDSCKSATPMTVTAGQTTGVVTINGQSVPQCGPSSFAVPDKIKQVDGRHFCSWGCVADYASKQYQGTPR